MDSAYNYNIARNREGADGFDVKTGCINLIGLGNLWTKIMLYEQNLTLKNQLFIPENSL